MAEELSLADLSAEDRKSLKFDHSLLDQFAAQMEAAYKLPSGVLTALKNAGEMSGSKSVSPKGAKGVMQLMPGTAKEVGVEDPTDPFQAIEGAAKYVNKLREQLGTDDVAILAAAYNAGPNRASLKRGEIPKIPETRDYVTRVKAYMQDKAGTAVVSAMPINEMKTEQNLPPGVSYEDLTPKDQRAYRKSQGLDPTDEMSVLDKSLAGAGKFFSDTGRGLSQLVGDAIVNPASRAVTGRDLIDTADMRAEERERRRLDSDLMSTKAGLGGYFGAAALSTALPGSWLSKAAPVVGATNLLSKVPVLGAVAPYSIPAAVSGGALSALNPVAEEGERLRNMKTGAVFGAVAAPIAAAVSNAAAKAVPKVVNYLGDKLNIPGLWSPSVVSKLAPGERQAIETAMEQGVPVYMSQVAKPGSSLPPARARAQIASFDRAIARTFGEDTDDLVKAFANAEQRLSNNYERVLGSKVIPLGKEHLQDLKEVSKFNTSRSPRFPPNKELEELVERAISAAKQSKQMTGRDYQNMLQEYGRLMKQLATSTDTKAADQHAAQGVGKLIDAMTKQAEKAMTAEEMALFRQTNKEWRNMKQLEMLAPRGADGSINVRQLANTLARKRKSEFIYGKGDQTLPNLARFGNTYMGLEATKPKGIINQGKEMARAAAPYLAGDVAGAYLMGNAMGGEHANQDSVAGEALKYGALGLLTHGLLTGAGNAMNPAMNRADMFRPRGALGELAVRAQPGAAAGMTYNAAREED